MKKSNADNWREDRISSTHNNIHLYLLFYHGPKTDNFSINSLNLLGWRCALDCIVHQKSIPNSRQTYFGYHPRLPFYFYFELYNNDYLCLSESQIIFNYWFSTDNFFSIILRGCRGIVLFFNNFSLFIEIPQNM